MKRLPYECFARLRSQLRRAAFATSARAASLFYSVPSPISGVTSILGPSGVYTTLVDAKNLGGGATVVINGVQFSGGGDHAKYRCR